MKHPVLNTTFRLSLVAAALSAGTAFALPTVDITGRITRGAAPKSFTMTLKMQGIAPTDRAQIAETDFPRQSIAIHLPKCPLNDRRLGYPGESATVGTTTTDTTTSSGLGDVLEGYQVEYSGARWDVVGNNESFIFTASFTVTQTGGTTAGCNLSELLQDNPLKSGTKGVNLSIFFKGVATHAGKSPEKINDNYYVNQSLAVANEAPADVTAVPAFRGVTATYTQKATINFKSDTGGDSADAPSGVVAILVATDQPTFQVHGKTYKSAGEEPFASCTIEPSSDTCITCPAGAYLDFETMKTSDEASKMKIQDVVDGMVTFSGLDPDKTYRVGMVYQPDALAFSTCSMAQPRINYSLTELNQDDAKTSQKNPTCFIATAAYGSILDHHIDILRSFRNRYMLTNKIGKSLVRFYYTHSPKIAAEIAKSDTARWATRMVLAPIVGTAFLANEYPLLLALNVIALCLLGGYLMQRRSRRWVR